jgi:hypothetical protein
MTAFKKWNKSAEELACTEPLHIWMSAVILYGISQFIQVDASQ